MRNLLPLVLGLALAACGSTSREINSLNSTERELSAQIRALEDVRKANIALVAALKRSEREGNTPKVKAEILKARTAYESALAKLD